MIDLDKMEALAKAVVPGTVIAQPEANSDYIAAANPAAILALIAEVRALREENMLCRAAIENAVDMVDACAAQYDDDGSQGALRATKRELSEAIGKACPRLLMERPEGQKFYGLHWRELQRENGVLWEDAERYRHLREPDNRDWLVNSFMVDGASGLDAAVDQARGAK